MFNVAQQTLGQFRDGRDNTRSRISHTMYSLPEQDELSLHIDKRQACSSWSIWQKGAFTEANPTIGYMSPQFQQQMVTKHTPCSILLYLTSLFFRLTSG